jgi:DNA-binding MurR/RpiR family transcriptional regulator
MYDILTESGGNMNDIIFRLFDFINNSKTKDINYFIALTLLHDVNSIGSMNITALAERCYTSPAAITRFCKKIGFRSFQEFKDLTQVSVEQYKIVDKLPHPDEKERIAQELQSALYNKIASWLNSSKDAIDIAKVSNIIELIRNSKKVSFYGTQLSQAIAQDFQLRLLRSNKFVNAFSDVQEQLEDTEELDENSVAIIVSPSGRFINGNPILLDSIKKSNCTVIIITHNKELTFLKQADIVFYLSVDSQNETGFTSERFSLMYLFDFMGAYYTEIYGYD